MTQDLKNLCLIDKDTLHYITSDIYEICDEADKAFSQDLSGMRLVPVAEIDSVYNERNRCVAALARCARVFGYDVAVTKTNIPGWDAEWHNCVYINLPTGQVSWHYHDRDAVLFEGIETKETEWDGHDTHEKYNRLYNWWPFAQKEKNNMITLNEIKEEIKDRVDALRAEIQEQIGDRNSYGAGHDKGELYALLNLMEWIEEEK
jgi:hypothetical protein